MRLRAIFLFCSCILLVYTSSIILYSCFFEVRAAEACSSMVFFHGSGLLSKREPGLNHRIHTTTSGAFVHAAVWILHRSQRHPNWTPGTSRKKAWTSSTVHDHVKKCCHSKKTTLHLRYLRYTSQFVKYNDPRATE